jgi:hypothetical protein
MSLRQVRSRPCTGSVNGSKKGERAAQSGSAELEKVRRSHGGRSFDETGTVVPIDVQGLRDRANRASHFCRSIRTTSALPRVRSKMISFPLGEMSNVPDVTACRAARWWADKGER